MKKISLILIATIIMSLAFIGCSSSQTASESSNDVEIPSYVVVDSNDISIPGQTRITYWLAVDNPVDEDTATAIALDASSGDSNIDEVTVWIYDSEEAAKNGMITNKMYDVILEKGKVADVYVNELYDFE